MKYLLLLILLMASVVSCFAPKQVTESKQTFIFDSTPKESSRTGSAGMILALVKPSYARNFEYGSGDLFKRFQEALGNDIEELIVGKGFSLKGPYEGFDEMIFEDKKQSEMLIQIEILPEFTAVDGNWRTHVSLLNPHANSYSYSGKASLVGKINLSGTEPLSNEKIWSKSVSIPKVENVPIATTSRYSRMLDENEILVDPGVYNAIGQALQTQYGGILDIIAVHFNVEEFRGLKGQIKELKGKKGY